MKITEQKLRKMVKEELAGLRRPYNRLDEGLFDFFSGLFNSFLALFGIEIQKASEETRREVTTYANQALEKKGIKDEEGKPVKYEDLDPDNPDHAAALKAIAPAMVEDALKGVQAGLEAMKDVPPLPEPPAGDADEAAKDQYKEDEAQMKKGAAALGKLLGATEALGKHYPEFKEVADQVKKNKPTAPADIFYQAGVLAKALEDAEVFKEHFQRYEGLDKLHEQRFFHHMTLSEALEKETETNILSIADAVEALSVQYLNGSPETKEFAALSDPSKLPSTEAEGEMGEAAQEAQAAATEGGEVEFDIPNIIKLAGEDVVLMANVIVMMPEEKAAEFLATLDPEVASDLINTASVPAITALTPERVAEIGEILELELPVLERRKSIKGKELVQAALAKMDVEQIKSIAKSGDIDPELEEMFTAVVGEEPAEPEFVVKDIINLAGDDAELLANALVMMPEENVVELLAKLEIPLAAQVVNNAIKITSLDPDIIGVVGEELELELPVAEEAQPVNGTDIVKAAMEKLGPDSAWGNVMGSITKSDEIEDEAKKALGVQTEGRWIGDGKRLSDLLFEGRKPQKRMYQSNTTLARWGQLAGLDKD